MPLGRARAQRGRRGVGRQDLGVDLQLAQPARDQLGVLRAEVEDDDACLVPCVSEDYIRGRARPGPGAAARLRRSRVAERGCYSQRLAPTRLHPAVARSPPRCGRQAAAPPPPLFPLSNAWTASRRAPPSRARWPPTAERLFVHTRDGSRARLRRPRTASAPGGSARRRGLLTARRRLRGGARAPDGTVRALDAGTGAARWKVGELRDRGHAAAASCDGDRVLVAGRASPSLDAATGRTAVVGGHGEPKVDGASRAQAARCVLLGRGRRTLRCRDAATGAPRWDVRRRGGAIVQPAGQRRPATACSWARPRREFLALDRGRRRARTGAGRSARTCRCRRRALARPRALRHARGRALRAQAAAAGTWSGGRALPSRPLAGPLLVRRPRSSSPATAGGRPRTSWSASTRRTGRPHRRPAHAGASWRRRPLAAAGRARRWRCATAGWSRLAPPGRRARAPAP